MAKIPHPTPAPPTAATLHQTNGAAPQHYQQHLDTVDATTRTADNILTVISDPRKTIAIAILIITLLALILIFRSRIKNALSTLWDTLARPFRDAKAESDAEQYVNLRTGEQRTATDLTPAEASIIADDIHACFSIWGDNEQGIYTALNQIRSSNDWILLKQQYRSRPIYHGTFWTKDTVGLEQALALKLNDQELARCRQILIDNGVNQTLINFSTNQ